jgi:hypothetical protein
MLFQCVAPKGWVAWVFWIWGGSRGPSAYPGYGKNGRLWRSLGLDTPNNNTERDLFNAATWVTLEDGLKASFWSSSWLHGQTL